MECKLIILLLCILLAGATARYMSDAVSSDAMEQQRILMELEEVHQLRERMLQEGELSFSLDHHLAAHPSSFACCYMCD